MNELQHIVPQAAPDTLKKLTSFGYAIQSSEDTPLTKILPDFPCDNLKLIAQISETNPSAAAYQLIYRLYPYESFLPKDCHGSLKSLFESLEIEMPTAEKNSSWIRNLTQSKNQPKIVSVERPTLSKALLDTEAGLQYHKGKANK